MARISTKETWCLSHRDGRLLTSSAEVLRLLLWQSVTHDPESVVSHNMLITLTKAPRSALQPPWTPLGMRGWRVICELLGSIIVNAESWRSLGILESIANFWVLPVNRLATDYTTKFLKISFEGIKRNARPLSWGTNEGWAIWEPGWTKPKRMSSKKKECEQVPTCFLSAREGRKSILKWLMREQSPSLMSERVWFSNTVISAPRGAVTESTPPSCQVPAAIGGSETGCPR